MTQLPISMTITALQSIAELPDSPRNRLIGSALEAARLAMQMDAAKHEIEERLWALMCLMSVNLKEWAKELKT